MSWPLALLVGMVNGIFGAFLTAYAADWGTTWHRVSNMEGGRGMLIAFVYLPLGFLVGAILGVRVARAREVTNLLGGLGRLGTAAGLMLAMAAAGTGLAWVTAEHPPTLDGRELDLEYEVRLPPGYPARQGLRERDFRVAVVASSRDRFYGVIDFDAVRTEGEYVVVPGASRLRSRAHRMLSVSFDPDDAGGRSTQFVDLPLRPSPRRADLAWTGWLPLQTYLDGTPIPEAQRAQVRYRVRQARR